LSGVETLALAEVRAAHVVVVVVVVVVANGLRLCTTDFGLNAV